MSDFFPTANVIHSNTNPLVILSVFLDSSKLIAGKRSEAARVDPEVSEERVGPATGPRHIANWGGPGACMLPEQILKTEHQMV